MFSEISAVAKAWWLFVVLGVICLGVGIATLVWPDKTLLTLGILAGIYLMMVAVLEIIDAIVGEPGSRALSAILGVITLIVGLIVFRRPGESLLAVVVAVGIFLIAAGVLRVVLAFGVKEGRGWGIGLGAIDAILGIIILAWPGIGLVTFAVFFAISMLFHGVISLVVGFKLRGLRNVDEQPAPPTAAIA
jgi:uncharacterized membrane protein HdeD (DUF308 family)